MSDSAVMHDPDELLVVGLGVRYLAESARQAGFQVTAVDAFADRDTAAASRAIQAAEATPYGVIRAALGLGSPGNGLVYGGGFEGRPDLLSRLALRFRLFGNRPSVAALLANPRRFFPLLDELEIPYPEIRLEFPDDPAGWLVKRGASCGGAAVRAAEGVDRATLTSDTFFQRRINGPAVSVLFAADGARARIIGYSRLFAERRGDRPYTYAGAMTWNDADVSTRGAIRGYVEQLTRAVGLVGINGLDLTLSDGGEPLLLELNARPTATLELHADRLPGGAVLAHLAACDRRLPEPVRDHPPVFRGYRVMYADHPLVMGSVHWPSWVRDRPREGTRIPRDAPLCTIHAAGTGVADLKKRLRAQSRCLTSMIDQRETRAA